MAIDAEDVLVCLWRFLRFFIDTSHAFAQKFPFVSCILLLFFFVYVFFNLLLYHLPFLVFVAVLLRFFWTSEQQPAIETAAEEDRKDGEKLEDRSRTISRNLEHRNDVHRNREVSSLIRQRSRRTHFSNYVLPVCKEENSTRVVVVNEEKETLISFEHGQSSNTIHDTNQLDDRERETAENNGGSETSKPISHHVSDENEEEEEEEEDQYANNNNKKAVEWTEDDQKNVVDLGISEIERNRRLDSLIAKRRARKLAKLPRQDYLVNVATTSSVIDPPPSKTTLVTPIFVAKSVLNHPFEATNNSNSKGNGNGNDDSVYNDAEGLQIPGSAPSVLLPAKNPFDIPYDPTEEKPDLTADSFQEEFAAVNQKETMMLCRHESFYLGPFHQFNSDGQDRRDAAEFCSFLDAEKRRLKRQPGNDDNDDDDGLVEQLLSGNKPLIDHTPFQLVVETGLQCPTQVLDSETSNLEGETETNANDMVSEQDRLNDMENASNIDAISTITEVDTEPSIIEDSETASSSSFEVPNRSVEASNSLEPAQGYAHEDNNSMLTCSIPTTAEARYDSSPTASDKSKSIGMDDGLFFSDTLAIHTPPCSIASDLQVEVSEIGSPPLTVGNDSPADGESLSFDGEMEQPKLLSLDIEPFDDTNHAIEEMGKLGDSSSSDVSAQEDEEITAATMQLAEKLASHPFFESVSERIEKSSNPPDESVEENVVDNARCLVMDAIEVSEDQEKREGEEELISQHMVDNLAIPSEETNLGPCIHSEADSEGLLEHQSLDFSQPMTRDTDLNVVEDSPDEKIEEESIREVSKSIEAKDNLISTTAERRYHEEKESLVEEVPVNPSIPSSPMSTPVERITVGDVFPSSANEDQIQMDVPVSHDVEHVVKSSPLNAQPLDHTSLIRPQNGEDLVVNLSGLVSNTGRFETLKEPSTSEKISDEINIVLNISEPVFEDKSGTEEFESNKVTKEEAETLLNPEVATLISEAPADIENALGNLTLEPANPTSEASEEGNVQIV